MAVIQISKIQVRRGLQENLPQLASGEMGWSIDSRKLYIGNGTLSEGAPQIGNTEILTANSDVLSAIASYTFKGTESGYTSRTGIDANHPVTRTLQNKIDEQISARDFGAKGDGLTDDTLALQRAIDQVFPVNFYTSTAVRRVLHIPAGVYLTTSTLTVPPYAKIVGDGQLSTIIRQTNSAADSVIKLRDSRGQIDADLGTNSAVLPFQIEFDSLSLQNTTDKDVANINSATDITFNRVNFVGAVTLPVIAGNARSTVTFLDNAGKTQRVTFNQCQFKQSTYAWNITGNVASVLGNDCVFDTLYQGITTSANVVSPQAVKVVSSVFDNIAKQAINATNDSSVTSAFNLFKEVGNSNGVTISSYSANTAVLSWSTANNYSSGDIFERTTSNILVKPTIEITGTTAPSLVQRTTAGSAQSTSGYTETLTSNVWIAANTGLVISTTTTNVIDYSISRGTAYRVGTIKVTQNNGTAVFEDDYSETTSTNTVLDFQGFGSNVTMTYTTSNSIPTSNATLKYTIRSFI